MPVDAYNASIIIILLLLLLLLCSSGSWRTATNCSSLIKLYRNKTLIIIAIVDDDCDTSNEIVMDYNLMNNINYEQWYRSHGGESWSWLLETTVSYKDMRNSRYRGYRGWIFLGTSPRRCLSVLVWCCWTTSWGRWGAGSSRDREAY